MDLKLQAALKALSYIEDGMVLGLGSGSTVNYFIEQLGKKLNSQQLHAIMGVPTSEETAKKAVDNGITLTSLSINTELDLAIDGADEVDPNLNLTKGLGRALLREKIVAVHAKRFIIIVDESKLVKNLGEKKPLPVEIVKFEAEAHIRWLMTLGCRAELFLDSNGKPIETDNGNFMALCWFENGIDHLEETAIELEKRPGIVEHGLFINMAELVLVATQTGVKTLERKK